jgi:short-subunit dehydrogenase
MADQRRGLIVNVGSIVGIAPLPFAGAYAASKSAVHTASEVLRMEVKPYGIGVVVVQPGGVRSSIADNGAEDIERYRAPPSRYAPFYAGIHKRAYTSQDHPMPAEEFARELVRQALTTPPPRLVRLGTGVDFLPRVAELPGEQRDGVFAANYGLDAPLDGPAR